MGETAKREDPEARDAASSGTGKDQPEEEVRSLADLRQLWRELRRHRQERGPGPPTDGRE